jgi:hypothetical protein
VAGGISENQVSLQNSRVNLKLKTLKPLKEITTVAVDIVVSRSTELKLLMRRLDSLIHILRFKYFVKDGQSVDKGK